MSASSRKNSRESYNSKDSKSTCRSSESVLQNLNVLEDIAINDETWRCIVVMLVETQENEVKYTSMLNEASEKGYRKMIYVVSREKLVGSIHKTAKFELLHKGDKAADASESLERIREIAKRAVRACGDSSPTFFQARLIKWMIYEARLEAEARNAAELEVAAEIEREFQMMQEVAKGKSQQQHQKSRPSTSHTAARRPNSTLRMRGEEWRDIVYVDDAPCDGPNLYILLTGFRDPDLPLELIKVGVPLYCILRLESTLCSCSLSSICNVVEKKLKLCPPPVPSCQYTSTKKDSSCEIQGCLSFWDDFNGDTCAEVMMKLFRVPLRDSDIYDCASYSLFDVHDTLQSYSDYSNSMKVVEVFEQRPDSPRMSSYEEFKRRVPEECASVPVVLEALLQQVEDNIKFKEALEAAAAAAAAALPRCPNESDDEADAADEASLGAENSAAFARLEEKLHLLNLKYGLIPPQRPPRRPERSPQLELILHGDLLGLNARFANDCDDEEEEVQLAEEQDEAISGQEKLGCRKFAEDDSELVCCKVALLEEPRIARARRDSNEADRFCTEHLAGIFKCCKMEGIERPRANHLLNILTCRKVIKSYLKNPKESEFPHLSAKSVGMEEGTSLHSCGTTQDLQIKSTILNDLISTNETDSAHQQEVPESTAPTKVIMKSNLSNIIEEDEEEVVSTAMSEETCTCQVSPSRQHKSASTQSADLKKPSELDSLRPASIATPSESSRTLKNFEACPPLFGLIDVRESLGAPDSTGNSGPEVEAVHEDDWRSAPMALEEFEDAEPLARPVFLQIVRDCFQRQAEYGGLGVVKQFMPTDSTLLLFCREPRKQPDKIIERRVTIPIRTPVCLRDFCDYVLAEERDWIKAQHDRRMMAIGGMIQRCRREAGEEAADSLPMLTDRDFILPGSLKAAALEALAVESSETASLALPVPVEKKENGKGGQARQTPAVAGRKKNRDSGEAITSRSSSAAVKKDRRSKGSTSSRPRSQRSQRSQLSSRVASDAPSRTFDFIGYDLGGRRRVQLSNFQRLYEARDGTRIALTHECWMLGSEKKPRTTVTTCVAGFEPPEVEAWSLRCQRLDKGSVFHLALGNGIIVAFQKLQCLQKNSILNQLLYDIRITWPTGLVIKPMKYECMNYPLCILQYYTSTGPGSKNIEDESHRKYLHNGDVIKFLNNGSIVVLRPNGIIITVLNFDQDYQQSMARSENTSADLIQSVAANQDFSLFSFESSCGTICSSFGFRSAYDTLHYRVLEADGRQYEVQRGRHVRELDRLRASIAEEYDPEEKFARRDDGTDMLFNKHAELVVNFPDGTRTLFGCTIEDEPACCDWTPEELEKYSEGYYEPEGFVSVVAYHCAEHPNYATVERDSGDVCGVSTGTGGLYLRLDPRRSGAELRLLQDRDRIKLQKDSLYISRGMCHKCQSATSHTTFKLTEPPSKKRGEDQQSLDDDDVLLTFCDDHGYMTVARSDLSFNWSLAEKPLDPRCSCKKPPEGEDERAWKLERNRGKNCRIFSVNKEGQAYEYHHRSVRKEFEATLMDDYEASLIQVPMNKQPGMECHLFLKPQRKILGGKRDWTLAYTIPKAKPTPKQWFFVDRELQDELSKWDQPLKAQPACKQSRLLTARLFETIDTPHGNSILSVQKALVRYWRYVATGTQKKLESTGDLECCMCPEEAEGQLRDISQGRVRTIDWKLYEKGQQALQKLKSERDCARIREMISRVYKRKLCFE